MSRLLSKSSISTVFILASFLLFASAMVMGAAGIGAMALGALDEPTVNDTEPVGDITTSTTVTDPAWVGGNSNTAVAYTSDGNPVWQTNLTTVRNYTGGSAVHDGKIYYAAYDYKGDGYSNPVTIYVLNQSDGEIVNTISDDTRYHISDIRINQSGTPLIIEDNSVQGRTQLSMSESAEYQYRIDNGTLSVYGNSGNGLYDTSPSNYYGDWTFARDISADMYTETGYSPQYILESTDNYAVVLTENSTQSQNLQVVSRTASSNTTLWQYDSSNFEGGLTQANLLANGSVAIHTESYEPSNSYDNTYRTHIFDPSDESVTLVADNIGNERDDTHPFSRSDFFRNLTFVGEGQFSVTAEAEQPSGITIQNNATIEVFEDGRLIWERTYNNQTERDDLAFYGDNIDAYIGDNYTVRVEAPGYIGEYQNATVQSFETTNLSYTLTYVGTGSVEVESVTNESGATIDGYDVQVYSVANDEVVASADNITGSYKTQVTAQQDYQVFVTADGYQQENKTYSVSENNTSSQSFVLSQVETTTDSTNTTTTEDNDSTIGVFVGSSSDSSGILTQIGSVIGVVIGLIFFPFSMFFLILFLLWLRRRRDDSGRGFGRSFGIILLVGMVAIAVVAPYMVGPASAQDTTEYEPADLLVFTASENKSQSTAINNDVIALDAQTGDEAWRTELYDAQDESNDALAVAWDNSTNQVYAVGLDPVDNIATVYELQDSTGNITDSEQLNISVDSIGTRAVAENGTLVFSSESATYRYNSETNELTTVYQYPEQAWAYDVGYDEDDTERAETFVWNDTSFSSYVYDNGSEQQNFSTESGVNQVEHLGDGWLYQQLDIYYLGDDGTQWNITANMVDTPLLGATHSGEYVYARVGDGLRRFNQSDGSSTSLNTGLSESGTVGKMQVDYRLVNDSGTIHTYNTVFGQGFTTSTQTHHYRVYDAETGDILYSESIAYDSNLHQSVAIVYDSQDTQTAVVGSSQSGVLGGEVLLAIALLLGSLIGLGIVVLMLRSVWGILIYPVKLLLVPFRLVWSAIRWIL